MSIYERGVQFSVLSVQPLPIIYEYTVQVKKACGFGYFFIPVNVKYNHN